MQLITKSFRSLSPAAVFAAFFALLATFSSRKLGDLFFDELVLGLL